jgi:peptide/nickel transport system substrate-binding protein
MNYSYKSAIVLSLSLLLVLSAFTAVFAQDEEGELLKEINLEVRTSRSTGIGDTAEGTLDLFMEGVPGKQFEGISESMRQNLGRIRSAGSYNNLYFNPAASAKYTCDVGGQRKFNPYSIEKFRYAMNWLVDREKIVEEIYNGYAEVRPTSVVKSVATYDKYVQPVVEKHGISASGDFEKAKTMITEALESAQGDSELKGELKKMEADDSPVGYWWAYKGPNEDEFSPIRPIVMIRVEDERKQIGQYYCDQLEKVGIKPDRKQWDRRKAIQNAWYTDPKDLKWHVYTGGWIASGNSYFERFSSFQMYAPFYGYMPGGFAGETAWKYKQEELDKYGSKIQSGELETVEGYWETFQKCIDLGVEESVRVFLTTTFNYYPYNNKQVVSFVPDGKIGWSSMWTARTMKTKDGVLDTAEFASQGNLFMDNWNYIGGSTDVYSQRLLRLMRDTSYWMDPQTGLNRPIRSEWTNIEKDYSYEEGELKRGIEVPEDAVYYDTKDEKWKKVESGTMAATSATYQWKFSKFHDGHMMDDTDLVASWAFDKEWSYKDGEDDRKFNSGFSGQTKPFFENVKGVVWHGDGKFTVYGDYTFPADSMIGMYYNIDVFKPWEIDYAAGELVASEEPSPVLEASYTWEESEGSKWVHFISENQGKDFRAKLESMKENFNVPPYLKEENNSPAPITSEELSEEVDSVNEFYDEYGHFYPAQGPFVLTNYDAQNKVMNFERFDRIVDNPEYPFSWDYWAENMKFVSLTIGNIQAPTNMPRGSDFEVSISAEKTQTYPTEESSPAEEGNVEVRLLSDGKLIHSAKAELSEPGEFTATIPADATLGLEAGAYELKVVGSLPGQEASLVESTTTIVLV